MKEQTKFNGAIHTDNKPLFQPKGSLLYSLNSVMSSNEGDQGGRTNELGNISCLNLEAGYKVIGHQAIEDKVILFITNDTISIIGEKDEFCNFTPLIQANCLGFKACNQIQCEFEIVNGCERVIYFVDGVNKDKSINLDSLESYLKYPGGFDVINEWDCGLMEITPSFNYPIIELDEIKSGGSLDLGNYQIALRYGQSNINQYAYDIISNNLPISNHGSNYNNTEGGTVATVGKVSSSIKIGISNLDLRYSNVTLVLISRVDGVTSANEIITLPVSSTIDYIFPGLTNKMPAVAVTELAVDTISYDVSKTLKIHDNRLLRGNIKEAQIDWHLFQESANNIKTFYNTSANEHGNFATFDGYKNPKATFRKKSYLRDEVYSLAIVWVFKNGTKSPAFHIPGRRKDYFPNGDIIPNTGDPIMGSGENTYYHMRKPLGNVISNNWDSYGIANNGFDIMLIERDKSINPDATERWEIYNTSLRTEIDDSGTVPLNKGIMSYVENKLQYPDTLNCDAKPIYPHTENNDGSFTMDKVRHHKMPDTDAEPFFLTGATGEQYIIQLGIEFKNVLPPTQHAEDVQGYYIVKEERNSTNKSVVDKGIIYNNVEVLASNDETYLVQSIGANAHLKGIDGIFRNRSFLPASDVITGSDAGSLRKTNTNLSFHGPSSKFNGASIGSGDYLKLDGAMHGTVGGFGRVRNGDKFRSAEHIEYTSLNNTYNYTTTELGVALLQSNFKIKNQAYVAADELDSTFSNPFLNDCSQETYVIETSHDVNHKVNEINSDKDTVLEIASGDDESTITPNTESSCFYGAIKKYYRDYYGDLSSASYNRASDNIQSGTEYVDFNGDSFITKFSFKRSGVTIDRTDSDNQAVYRQVITSFVESDINTELRHSIDIPGTIADTSETTYYPKQDLTTFLSNSDVVQLSNGEWNETSIEEVITGYKDGLYSKNFYRYNTDFSLGNTIKTYFLLATNFKYCTDCLNTFPHKIVYSNKSLTGSSSLEKRIFLANSSTEISNKFGAITNMFTDNDQLWIHSERSLFRQQTKPNEMQAGASTVFIGVGEIFSIPPSQMRTIDTGYAGSKHKFATHTNEMGTYFVSADEGKIFRIQGSELKEISAQGNRALFDNKLPMVFEKQYEKLTNTKYTCAEGTAANTATGFISAYDYENKRWILHKKDYKIISEDTWDATAEIDFTDTTIYENLSWTASFVQDQLISWHSYAPDYLFNTQNGLFTVKDNGIWEHNKGLYQTYYGTSQDHILEWVNNDAAANTKIFNNIEYRQSCDKLDLTYNDWVKDGNHTFNKLVAYNDVQSTGELTVAIKNNAYDSLTYNPATALAFHKDNLWRVNQLRDMSISTGIPNFTTNWNNIQSTYPIDKVVNNVNIDLSKSQYELARLRGKYLIIRGTFNNPDKTLKLSTEFINTEYDKSVR